MLLTKIVMMKWHGSNKKWYEDKGYKFTKYKDEFEVKVEDLTNGSGVLVEVKCDGENCKHPYLKPMMWKDYLRTVKNGKYYCVKCVKLFTANKMIQTKLENSKSFEQWCIENNRQDILHRWDYELNDCKPDKISYRSSRKKYWFKCPKGIHKSELKNVSDFAYGKCAIICKQCNSFAQWGTDNICDDFLDKYWDWDKNVVNPWNVTSHGNKKVWIKCQEKKYHDSYEVLCNDFRAKNCRCPYCCNCKIHPLDSLGALCPEVLEIWSNKNKNSSYEYAPMSHKEIWWKCSDGVHEDYNRSIKESNNYNFRCPDCSRERSESFLQEKVRLHLNEFNYTILHERNCTIVAQNPKVNNNLGKMPYDNEIKELKLIIEVHGKQHYMITNYAVMTANNNNTTPEYELHRIKLHDRYKRIFAKSQGYFYLEIPYWTDDKNETWRKLIDDKIAEIKEINKE